MVVDLGRIGCESALGFFAADVDFDQHVQCLAQLLRGIVEPLGELGGVDGIDRLKNLRRLCCLVRLQVADHVEPGICEFSDLGIFVGEFLDAVFAEEALSGSVGFEDCVGGEGLADGHQGNVGGVAASALRGGGDAVANRGEVEGWSREVQSKNHSHHV